VALLVPGWPVFTALRAVEAVLHNSLFRSGYELLFVPMDAGTRRRAKTVLDVLCDRVGDAAGSAIVQLVLLAGVTSPASSLLSAVLVLAAASLWLGQRFGPLCLGLIQDQLLRFHEAPQVSMISEAGWTLLSVPAAPELERSKEPAPLRAASVLFDPAMQTLAELRSDDASRVVAALSGAPLERLHVAQLIDLLWRGYRLLDRPEQDDRSEPAGTEEDSSRYLEYVRLLLSTIVPREPLGAAVHAVRSANPGVRGLAFEYLEQVVPPAVLERLKVLIASMPSGAGVASQSDGPSPSTGSPAPR
jgi:hypothetical protein